MYHGMNENTAKLLQESLKEFSSRNIDHSIWILMMNSYQKGRDDLREEIKQQYDAIKLLGILEKEDIK